MLRLIATLAAIVAVATPLIWGAAMTAADDGAMSATVNVAIFGTLSIVAIVSTIRAWRIERQR